jgi:hypothetical protein
MLVVVIVITNQDSTSSRLLPGSSYNCCIRNLHALVHKHCHPVHITTAHEILQRRKLVHWQIQRLNFKHLLSSQVCERSSRSWKRDPRNYGAQLINRHCLAPGAMGVQGSVLVVAHQSKCPAAPMLWFRDAAARSAEGSVLGSHLDHYQVVWYVTESAVDGDRWSITTHARCGLHNLKTKHACA